MSTNPLTIIQTADIPPIPHVLQRILALTNNPNTTSAELEKLVAQEPALVTKLLKWVNSAQYALPSKVSSVSHSMILLGFSTVRSIASGLLLMNSFDMMDVEDKTFITEVWKHTLTAANYVKIICYREPIAKQDDLFLAAMIHDVGYIVLSEYFGKKYQMLTKKGGFPKPEAEDVLLGVNHVLIGSTLLKHWRFPDHIIEMVRLHHSFQEAGELRREVAFLIIGDELSRQTDLDAFFEQDEKSLDPNLLAAFETVEWSLSRLKSFHSQFADARKLTDNLFGEPAPAKK